MIRTPRSRWNQEQIRRAAVCSVGLLALLVAGIAFPTGAYACHVYCYDYGDAPDDLFIHHYWTLGSYGGAQHTIVPGFHLGEFIDAEADGQPSLLANGDDLIGFGPDDEDGILFESLLLPAGDEIYLTVVLTDTALLGDARLNAWVDFNADGDWSDLGEQIFIDELLSSGDNSLSFLVPEGATLGETYARFRLNSGGGLTYNGSACNGEVEDYMVAIVPEPAALSLMALGLTGLAAFRRLCA